MSPDAVDAIDELCRRPSYVQEKRAMGQARLEAVARGPVEGCL